MIVDVLKQVGQQRLVMTGGKILFFHIVYRQNMPRYASEPAWSSPNVGQLSEEWGHFVFVCNKKFTGLQTGVFFFFTNTIK